MADCRTTPRLAKRDAHGTVTKIDLELGAVMVDWPHDPALNLLSINEVRWHQGAEVWYIPRLPQEGELIVSATDPSCIGYLFYDLDEQVGVVWADNIQSLARLVESKDADYDAYVEQRDDEPSTAELGLAVVERDKLSWNEFGYWVIID